MPTSWKRSPEELHKTYVSNTEAFYRAAGRGVAPQLDKFVQDCALAMAATSAGALGSLPAAMLSGAELRQELSRLAASGPGPYNINFFCHRQHEPEPAAEQRWRQVLLPYYAEFGVDAAAPSRAPSRAPFNDEHAALLAEFRPAVVSFHFGLPEPELLAQVKATGAKVFASATTVAEAQWLADH